MIIRTLVPNAHPPSGRAGGIPAKVGVDGDQPVAESLPSDAGTERLPDSTFEGALSNGDGSDARMVQIQELLGHAAMHILEKCELVAEWVHHAEAKLSVFGQIVPKPKGGRPEGGIARAARELPVPGKSPDARRKFIQRALKIDGIWPQAKSAARAQGLGDTQSALLEISDEKSLDKQLPKVQEITARKAKPRRKSCARHSDEPASDGDTNSTVEDEAQLGTFKALASDEKSEPPSNPEIDQSKPASFAALLEFAKFTLAHINRKSDEVVLALTASDDVKEFNTLANRAQKVIGGLPRLRN
jgi:hypothetical protein